MKDSEFRVLSVFVCRQIATTTATTVSIGFDDMGINGRPKKTLVVTLTAPANFAQQQTAEQLGSAKTDLQAQWRAAAPTVWVHGALGTLLCS